MHVLACMKRAPFSLSRYAITPLIAWWALAAKAQPTPEWINEQGWGPGNHHAACMRVNAAGRSFSIGQVQNDTTAWTVVRVLEPTGLLAWYDSVPGMIITELEINAQDELFCTGRNDTNACVTLKYAADGSLAWLRVFDSGNGPNKGLDLALNADGSVMVTGESRNTGQNTDYLVLKYGADGTELWNTLYDATTDWQGDRARSIAVDAAGNSYVLGASCDTINGSVLLVSFDPNGLERWHRRTSPLLYSSGELVAVQGNNVITTSYASGIGYGDVLTTAYDTSGTLLWENQQAIPQRDFPKAMALDAAGGIYIVGSKNIGNSWYHDILTIALNSDGTNRWIRTHDGGTGFDHGTGVAVDDLGRVLCVGYGPDTTMNDRSTLVTLCYDTAGTLLWLARYAPSNDQCASGAVGVDAAGAVYAFGDRQDQVPSMQLVNLKYGTDTSVPVPNDQDPAVSCYPVPADRTVNIRLAPNALPTRCTVLSTDGRLIMPPRMIGSDTSVDVTHLANGHYVVRLEVTYDSARFTRFVVQHP